MNAAILIASRELRNRSRLFLIAAAMAVVPFAASLTVRENRALAIATVAAFLAAVYAGALSLALGASMIGGELSQRRSSFLFSKPLSAASIWIGKASAGMLTWLGAFAIVALPAYLLVHSAWKEVWVAGGDAITAGTIIAGTVLFFVSHAVSTIIRSRSALVAVDFVLLGVWLAALFGLVRPIAMYGGLDLVVKMLVCIGVVMLMILAVAPVWQIAQGRIDPRRNHSALSKIVWSGAAIVLLITAAYTLWVRSPKVSSMFAFDAEQSPSGEWVYLVGIAPNRGSYVASFLINSATGERERVPPSSAAHFSADGTTLTWMESTDLLPPVRTFRLHTQRLEAGAKQIATPLVMTMPRFTHFSDDGSRIALISGERLEVYEVASGRLLAAVQGTDLADVRGMRFVSNNDLRVVDCSRSDNGRMRIRQFDIARRKFVASFERPSPTYYAPLNFTLDGSRVYLREEGTIVDARNGALLATLGVKPERAYFGAMLRDGSAIVTRDSKLYHFDSNGKLVAEMAIPVPRAIVAGTVGRSRLLLSIGGDKPSDSRTLFVDLAARKVDVALPGVRIAYSSWGNLVVPQFAENATILAIEGDRNPVLLDARTGAKRPFPS